MSDNCQNLGYQPNEKSILQHSLKAVFGEELADDIFFVLKNMFTIHESQLKIFPTEFPFARNKVEKKDIPRIEAAINEWPNIYDSLSRVKAGVDK